jgi:hypothetical protein
MSNAIVVTMLCRRQVLGVKAGRELSIRVVSAGVGQR